MNTTIAAIIPTVPLMTVLATIESPAVGRAVRMVPGSNRRNVISEAAIKPEIYTSASGTKELMVNGRLKLF